MLAGEGLQIERRALSHGLADVGGSQKYRTENPGPDRQALGNDRGTVALCGVPGGGMADLVAQHAGEFGFRVGQAQQPARDVDVSAGQGEGIHDVVVEHGESELEIGELGDLCEVLCPIRFT